MEMVHSQWDLPGKHETGPTSVHITLEMNVVKQQHLAFQILQIYNIYL